MSEYKLYYWNVPFRGNFIQIFLEEVSASYEKLDASKIYPDKRLEIHSPGMAPPYLYDSEKDSYLAQMPAILIHLGRKFDYLPKCTESLDLALKIILDCNDVIMEFTNFHGMKIWNIEEWSEFRGNRLTEWMRSFEKIGFDNDLIKDNGYILGATITVADIAVAALFGTMTYCFPELKYDLRENAPFISSLCDRIEGRPPIQKFLHSQRLDLGRIYCGGEIEKSLRKMVSND